MTYTQTKQFNQAIAQVEANTCYRLTGATNARGGFFVPVASDGETVIGECFELSWRQIKNVAALEKPII